MKTTARVKIQFDLWQFYCFPIVFSVYSVMIDVVVENNLYMENFLKRKVVDVTLPSLP